MVTETRSPEETYALGEKIGKAAQPGQIYTLTGDFDVYRIGDIEEMEEIGYDDYFFGNGICLIEWAELIEEILPDNVISITIEKDLTQGFDYRKITVDGL